MRKPRRKVITIGFVLMLVVLGVLFGWGMYIDRSANHYLDRLHASASTLKQSLQHAAKTVTLPVFSDAGKSSTTDLDNLDAVDNSMQDVHTNLNQFNETAEGLHPAGPMSFLRSYHEARAEQANAVYIVDQTNDVLNQYRTLAAFLRQYYQLDVQFAAIMNHINTVSNLNDLSTQLGQLYTDKQTLSSLAVQAMNLSSPYDFRSLITQTSANYQLAATGLDTLAHGLAANDDNYQTIGAAQIEQATAAHDRLLINLSASNYQNSYVLRQVSELSNKTDTILAAQTSGD